MYCTHCNCSITKAEFNYSIDYFEFPLCRPHQTWVDQQLRQRSTTWQTMLLYLELKDSGVPAELEKHDGYKHVDIVIEEAKVHIEVDGQHHNYDGRQAIADLRRTYYSFKKGYFTLRIPNSLIYNHFDETVEGIIAVLELGRKRAAKKKLSFFRKFQ